MSPLDERRFIATFDGALAPLWFERRSRSQEWSKQVDGDRVWFHLNFGLSVVNPSVGVTYIDIERRWPQLGKVAPATLIVLGSLFDPIRSYSSDDTPEAILADLTERGLPAVSELRDRSHVLELLRSPNASNWPVPSFSHRIRLAPLLLAMQGESEAATELAEAFALEAEGRDQLVPKYGSFLHDLRLALAG